MSSRTIRGILIVLAAALVVAGYLIAPPGTDETHAPAAPTTSSADARGSGPEAQPREPAPGGIKRRVDDVAVKNYDKVVFRGSVDLSESIDRIRAGVEHSHRNDGSVFGNRERLLPNQARGYYREYVHPTAGISGPGPQRLVVGRGGDWWYTPDHYASFVSLGTEAR